MMLRSISTCLVLLVGGACATAAQCQCGAPIQAFCQSVVRDWKRNNCWPSAFLGADRVAVRAPFVVMVHNGWERQNLLGDHHFEEGGSVLNRAGEIKVRWIMTQAPRQHRTIYVHRADTPEMTALRMENVTKLAAQLAEEGQTPAVVETNLDTAGWPAVRVDMIDRRYLESMPEPRLPKAESGNSGGSN